LSNRKRIKLASYDFALKLQNEQVVSQMRKTGLFRTNAEVIDAALRALTSQLKREFADVPESVELPSEKDSLPVLPTPSNDG